MGDRIRTMALERPLFEVLAEFLRDKILNGDLLPGERLVEAELAKSYGVSRGPVREALRALDAEGLINIEKHRSPTVRGVDLSVFLQMFEVRACLEGYACRLAAKKIRDSEEDAQWAREQLVLWRDERLATDVDMHVATNKVIHSRLLRIAGHDLLSAQIEGLTMPGYRAVLESRLTGDQMRTSSLQHVEVLEAVLAGDGDAAESVMRRHVHAAGRRVAAAFSAQFLEVGK